MSFDPKQYADLAEAFLKKPALKWFFVTIGLALAASNILYRVVLGEFSSVLINSALLAFSVGIGAMVLYALESSSIKKQKAAEEKRRENEYNLAIKHEEARTEQYQAKVREFNESQIYFAYKAIKQNHQHLNGLAEVQSEDFQRLLQWDLVESTGLKSAKWTDDFWKWLIADRAKRNALLDSVAGELKAKTAKHIAERIEKKRAEAAAARRTRRFIDL